MKRSRTNDPRPARRACVFEKNQSRRFCGDLSDFGSGEIEQADRSVDPFVSNDEDGSAFPDRENCRVRQKEDLPSVRRLNCFES